MRKLFDRLLGRGAPPSSSDAKQRLKVLLVHDEVMLSPGQLDQMKRELLEVIGRYVEVDPAGVDVSLLKDDGRIALVSNVPVRKSGPRA